MSRPRKVLVMGSPGAGKSTFARRLGEATGLPVIHLDQHFWNSGWVATPPELFRQRVEALVAQPAWIMDGDYGGTMDLRMSAADTLIYIDMPRWLCMWGVFTRSFRAFGRTRPDMAPGCPEKFSWEFYVYAWKYHREKKPQRFAWLARYPEKAVVITGRLAAEIYLQNAVKAAA